jgi:hypothetical protein
MPHILMRRMWLRCCQIILLTISDDVKRCWSFCTLHNINFYCTVLLYCSSHILCVNRRITLSLRPEQYYHKHLWIMPQFQDSVQTFLCYNSTVKRHKHLLNSSKVSPTRLASLEPETITLTPRFARTWAHARPMPLVDPVIKATLLSLLIAALDKQRYKTHWELWFSLHVLNVRWQMNAHRQVYR